MSNNSNAPRFIILEGIALYSCVHHPNTANGENKYQLDLLLDPDYTKVAKENGFKMKTKKKKILKDELEKVIEDHMDADEVTEMTKLVEGRVQRSNEALELYKSFDGYTGAYVNVKLNAEKNGIKRQLTVIDAAKNVIPKTTLIGNGSKVKVKAIIQTAEDNPDRDYLKKYGSQAYFISGDQPTLQVLELVEYISENGGEGKTNTSDDFDSVEGGYVAPTPAEKPSNESDALPDDFEDDIPF